MGHVWLARNETTGADLALKVLRSSGTKGSTVDARFRNEARFAAGLSHRNIVRVFDLVEEDDGTLALVMELLRGEPAAELLARRGALSAREALAVVLPILAALGHAHGSGVVHRDVTPANMFLSVEPDGEVIPKLVDFGIAKLPVASSLTLEGAVLGTPRYMAPEQIRAASDIDGRADLFSAAVVLYELMTGVSPFAAPTPSAALAAVLESTVDPDPRIEPLVWVEIQRALSKRPYQRHANAAEMADALRAAVGETDAALAALLRRDPPAKGDLWGQTTTTAGITTGTSDGHSLDTMHLRPGGRIRGVAVGVAAAALLIGAAVIGVRTVRGPANASPTPPATSTPASTPTPAPTPTAAALPSPTEPQPVLTDVAPPASSAPSRPFIRRVQHPRPVAITPGF
jgi:serine/threonine-protein kinase